MDSQKPHISEWQFITEQLSEAQINEWNRLCRTTNSCVAASFHSFAVHSRKLKQTQQTVFALGYHDKTLAVVIPCQLIVKKLATIKIRQLQIVSHDHLDFFTAAGQFGINKTQLLESLFQALAKEKNFKWHLFVGRRWFLPNLTNEAFISSTYHKKAAYFDLKNKQAIEEVVSKKLVKNIRRHEKKLSEQVESFKLEEMKTPEQLDSAITDFILLEKEGWKGKAGSAIGSSQRLVQFYQHTWQELSQFGYARVYLLKNSQQTIAAAIGFEFKQRVYLHKIAYDESLAKFSPGSILVKLIMESMLGKQSMKELCFNTSPDWVKRWHPQYHELRAVIGFNRNVIGNQLKWIFNATNRLRILKRKLAASKNNKHKDN